MEMCFMRIRVLYINANVGKQKGGMSIAPKTGQNIKILKREEFFPFFFSKASHLGYL
jgi:hypothetical protein